MNQPTILLWIPKTTTSCSRAAPRLRAINMPACKTLKTLRRSTTATCSACNFWNCTAPRGEPTGKSAPKVVSPTMASSTSLRPWPHPGNQTPLSSPGTKLVKWGKLCTTARTRPNGPLAQSLWPKANAFSPLTSALATRAGVAPTSVPRRATLTTSLRTRVSFTITRLLWAMKAPLQLKQVLLSCGRGTFSFASRMKLQKRRRLLTTMALPLSAMLSTITWAVAATVCSACSGSRSQ